MSAAPVAHYLAEFGRGPAALGLPMRMPAPAAVLPLRHPAEEAAARLAEATQRGREEGRIAAFAECETAVAAERARSAAERVAERARWTNEEADRLGELIATGLAAIETGLADTVASLLKPLLAAQRREGVVDGLVDTIRSLIGHDAPPAMRIDGPADLIEALRLRLGPDATAIAYRENDQPDVAILCGDTLIETRFQAWAERLAEAQNG